MRQVLREFGLTTADDPATGDRLPQYELSAYLPDGALNGLPRDIVMEALSYLLIAVVHPPTGAPPRTPSGTSTSTTPAASGGTAPYRNKLQQTLQPTRVWQEYQ